MLRRITAQLLPAAAQLCAADLHRIARALCQRHPQLTAAFCHRRRSKIPSAGLPDLPQPAAAIQPHPHILCQDLHRQPAAPAAGAQGILHRHPMVPAHRQHPAGKLGIHLPRLLQFPGDIRQQGAGAAQLLLQGNLQLLQPPPRALPRHHGGIAGAQRIRQLLRLAAVLRRPTGQLISRNRRLLAQQRHGGLQCRQHLLPVLLPAKLLQRAAGTHRRPAIPQQRRGILCAVPRQPFGYHPHGIRHILQCLRSYLQPHGHGAPHPLHRRQITAADKQMPQPPVPAFRQQHQQQTAAGDLVQVDQGSRIGFRQRDHAGRHKKGQRLHRPAKAGKHPGNQPAESHGNGQHCLPRRGHGHRRAHDDPGHAAAGLPAGACQHQHQQHRHHAAGGKFPHRDGGGRHDRHRPGQDQRRLLPRRQQGAALRAVHCCKAIPAPGHRHAKKHGTAGRHCPLRQDQQHPPDIQPGLPQDQQPGGRGGDKRQQRRHKRPLPQLRHRRQHPPGGSNQGRCRDIAQRQHHLPGQQVAGCHRGRHRQRPLPGGGGQTHAAGRHLPVQHRPRHQQPGKAPQQCQCCPFSPFAFSFPLRRAAGRPARRCALLHACPILFG